MMTLWCMFRSLLMIGAELTKMDDFTLSLLTNKELLVLLSEDFRGEQLRRYFFELFMKVGAAGKSSFSAIISIPQLVLSRSSFALSMRMDVM